MKDDERYRRLLERYERGELDRRTFLGLLGAAGAAASLGGTLTGVLSRSAFAAAQRGGQMIVTYKSDVSTLDPAIGYDWQNWSMIKSLFNGLMDYKPGTTDLIPDLAESFTVSEDGTTYTFKLRQGVKFHNGRELTAQDVKYSLERTVNPKTQSPGPGFYDTIDGFDDVASGKSEHLAGVQAVDGHTVRIQLKRPDAPFLHKLALNFAFVVPREAVEKYGQDFGKHPVGTGAFKLAEWTLGQRVVFERNPDYYRQGLPKLDRIEFQIGQEPTVALLRLQRGEVDILGDGIPPARFLEVRNDPRWKDYVVEGDQLQTGYVALNVRMKPLDDVRVRRAINMAINKDRIVKIINNRAAPANQPLPPLMPGYAQGYAGYPYDPAKAKQLVAEAGHPQGVDTELYCMNVDPNPRIAQAIQQDLAQIGIRAQIKSLAQSTVIAAGGEPDQAPMVWSGGMAWIADFPDPSDFYGPILGCGGAVKGGWNWAWYCNRDIEAMAQKADAMADPAKGDERIALWRQIFVKIMDDAPWAPVFNEKRFTMRVPTLAGPTPKIFVDPVHIPVNYDVVYRTDA
jgi:ABC-type transport system substrate-binding protein